VIVTAGVAAAAVAAAPSATAVSMSAMRFMGSILGRAGGDAVGEVSDPGCGFLRV